MFIYLPRITKLLVGFNNFYKYFESSSSKCSKCFKMINNDQKPSVVAAPKTGLGNAAGRLYKFFEAYLKHWGTVMTCFAVVLMACSLKGELPPPSSAPPFFQDQH